MSSSFFLGIDTSNYTTSVAIADGDGNVLYNDKHLLTVPEGQRGVRQSDALFAHTKRLPESIAECRDILSGGKLFGVGVSDRPRAVEGSYMPCFLAGVNAANAASVAAGVPLFSFSHQCGHMMAAVHSAGASCLLDGEPFLAFHLSGGTTELLLARYQACSFSTQILCATADISCGQLIDRVAVHMGLPFPGGAHMEQLALQYTGKLPKVCVPVREGRVNLSGFENKLTQLYDTTADAPFVAAYTLWAVLFAIRAMLFSVPSYSSYPVLFSGGVMSCKMLQRELSADCDGHFSAPAFSSDNAAGIALLARQAYYSEKGA